LLLKNRHPQTLPPFRRPGNDTHVEKAVMNTFKTLKQLAISLVTLAGIGLSPAHSAGTTPLSLVNQFDATGHPLSACQVYFYVAGTVATPQDSFSDFGLTAKNPWPLPCDQFARVPLHWLADGLIHVRLIDSSGTPYVDTTMQVLGPSSGGGGGGGTVDPTSIMATGDIKVRYDNGALSGFVRCNALTIGNAVSGATERANADTQTLWIYLYAKDPNLVVSGGRTGNALNDYNAGKQLTMPDWRGRAIAGLADMGNSATTALTATGFGNVVTTLGAAGGNQLPVITMANLPASPAPVAATAVVPAAGNVVAVTFGAGTTLLTPSGTSATFFAGDKYGIMPNLPVSGNTANLGSATPFQTVTPEMLLTIYMKL
jgi:hypothetical protein